MKIRSFCLTIILLLGLTSFQAFAGISKCYAPCNIPHGSVAATLLNNKEVYRRKSLQNGNLDALNIKSLAIDRIKLAANSSTNKNARRTSSAIIISRNDIDNISAPRNTWLTFFGTQTPISMNIGIADIVNAQTWTLPAALLDSFTYYYNDNFIPAAEVPADLTFPEANKVLKSQYLDAANNVVDLYEHYEISTDSVTFLGASYYYYLDQNEDSFDLTDFKFSDIPLNLGDSYQFREDDNDQFRGLRYYIRTKSVDAFGTLETPYGNLECLRISISSDQYSRADSTSAYTLDGTSYGIGFITKNGLYFNGVTDDVSGMVSIQAVELKVVAPTGILATQSDVQINNDGAGVLISNSGVQVDVLTKTADVNAILDISSDNKGIMIPRLEESERPAAPNAGLLIYQTDSTPGFYYYDGSAWTRLDNTTPAPPTARISAANSQVPSKTYKKGFGKLVNGSAFIPLKAGSGKSPEGLLIQLQAEGECNGLYISNKTVEGFEVKELKNGKSNSKFSWTLNQL